MAVSLFEVLNILHILS